MKFKTKNLRSFKTFKDQKCVFYPTVRKNAKIYVVTVNHLYKLWKTGKISATEYFSYRPLFRVIAPMQFQNVGCIKN